MSNYCFGSEEDGTAGIANAAAEIHLFAVVKKLLIESAKIFKQFALKHYAAARLPVDGALRITLPPPIFFIREERRKFGEAKRSYPITPNRREKSRRNLISTVRIHNSAAEAASHGVAICKFYESIQRAIVNDSVRIQNKNIFAVTCANTCVISASKAEILLVLHDPDLRIPIAHKFN